MMETLVETDSKYEAALLNQLRLAPLFRGSRASASVVVMVTRGFQAKHLKEGNRVLKPQYDCPLHITVSQKHNYLSRKQSIQVNR
jgi:hypothetical protein